MTPDEQLKQDWEVFGRADGYDAPDDQELRSCTVLRYVYCIAF